MFLGDTQPDPGTRQLVEIGKNQQMLIAAADLPSVNAFKIGAASQMLSGSKSQVGHVGGGAGGLSGDCGSAVWLGGRFAFRYHNSSPRLAAGNGALNRR
ncbi:MAG: hypothetical protein JWN70_1961 [Planctomycetaceae bacterium]|nr:hypothetical protein [Planctomycetaceae bacterium]